MKFIIFLCTSSKLAFCCRFGFHSQRRDIWEDRPLFWLLEGWFAGMLWHNWNKPKKKHHLSSNTLKKHLKKNTNGIHPPKRPATYALFFPKPSLFRPSVLSKNKLYGLLAVHTPGHSVAIMFPFVIPTFQPFCICFPSMSHCYGSWSGKQSPTTPRVNNVARAHGRKQGPPALIPIKPAFFGGKW